MTRKPPVAREPVLTEAADRRRRHPARWSATGASAHLTDDPVLRNWLCYRGSLTGRIRRQVRSDFSLEVLSESIEPATEEDGRQLGCVQAELFVRRVRMSCDGVGLVFASTRVPVGTLTRQPWLGELRNRPLGEALADLRGVSRTPFEYAWVEDGDALHTEALSGSDIAPPGLWARRSKFLIQSDPILVYEVFLPGLTRIGFS